MPDTRRPASVSGQRCLVTIAFDPPDWMNYQASAMRVRCCDTKTVIAIPCTPDVSCDYPIR